MVVLYNVTMRRGIPASVALSVLVILLVFVPPLGAWADCVMETTSAVRDALVRHLSNTCTEEERLSHGVQAEELFEAILQGRTIDLNGVVIVGDIFLDRLPLFPVPTSILNPVVRELLSSRSGRDVRVVAGPIAIRDSRIQGTIATRLKDGYVLMQAPLTMTGTTFEGMLDLSHTIFTEPVDLSGAVFRREAFFIHTVLTRSTRFERVSFGVHTRFHQAHFAETVTFEGAAFHGVAEFLEATFAKDANFLRSRFTMGTGFSGARFGGMADFSDTRFERELFFLFTRFDGDARFRASRLQGRADFSDAEFHGNGDFSSASFAIDPLFQRTRLSGAPPTRRAIQHAQYWYGMAASFLIFTLLLVWMMRKGSSNDHHI